MYIISPNGVGAVTEGPWKGRLLQGNSLVTGPNGEGLLKGPTNEPAPSSNKSSCFPVFWQDFPPPTPDWFNKYALESVSVADSTGGASVRSKGWDMWWRPAEPLSAAPH